MIGDTPSAADSLRSAIVDAIDLYEIQTGSRVEAIEVRVERMPIIGGTREFTVEVDVKASV